MNIKHLKHFFSLKKEKLFPKFIIKIGNIEDDNTDVIITWSQQSLRSGPHPQYKAIVDKGGSQTQSSYLMYENGNPKPCDTFTIMSGMLECEILINSIIPPEKAMYNTNFLYISKCLQTYKRLENNCRFISLYIPDFESIETIIQHMIIYFKSISSLKEIRIFCLSDAEKNIIRKNLNKFL